MNTQDKERIIQLYKYGELDYISAIMALEEAGYESKEAEQIIEDVAGF